MANVNMSVVSQTTSVFAADENSSAINSVTEVHNDEQTQEKVSAAEQSEYSATPDVSEEYEADGAETAVSEISAETSVISDVPTTAMSAKNIQAFLLLAGVFAAVIAAMFLKRKFQKDKRKKTVDKSQLTAKERDEIRLAEKKRKKEKEKSRSEKAFRAAHYAENLAV